MPKADVAFATELETLPSRLDPKVWHGPREPALIPQPGRSRFLWGKKINKFPFAYNIKKRAPWRYGQLVMAEQHSVHVMTPFGAKLLYCDSLPQLAHQIRL